MGRLAYVSQIVHESVFKKLKIRYHQLKNESSVDKFHKQVKNLLHLKGYEETISRNKLFLI